MGKIRLFVFALTPRAGDRHHVYLVGRNDPRLKRRIEQLAPEINRTVASAQQPVVVGPDFVVAWHTVRQPTTGRLAPEWICVACDPAASLNPLEKAMDWLTAKLNELAQIVPRRSWNDVGPLFEELSELQSWQQEVEKMAKEMFEIYALDSGSAPGTEPAQPRTGRRRWLVGALLVGCLLLMGVLGFLGSPSIPKKGVEWCRKFWEWITGPKISWAKLAEAVGAPNQDQVPKQILEKLKCLFEPDSNNIQGPHETGSPQRTTPEQEIEKLLQAFEKAMGRSGKENLQTLSQSQTSLRELKTVFPQGEFDPMGLVEGLPPETARFWRALPPRSFYKLQNSLAQATKTPDIWQVPKMPNNLAEVLGLREPMSSYLTIFTTLADYAPSKDPDQSEQKGPHRSFYVPSDRDSLEKSHQVLTSICQACEELKKQQLETGYRRSSTPYQKGPCQDNAKACIQMIVGTLAEHVPRTIETIQKVPNPKEKHLGKFRQALEELQNLVHKWSNILAE